MNLSPIRPHYLLKADTPDVILTDDDQLRQPAALIYGRIDQFGLCPFLGSSQKVAELIHTSVRQSEFLELLNNCWRRFLAPGKANFGDRNFIADLAPDNCRCSDLYSGYGQQRDSGLSGVTQVTQFHPGKAPYRKQLSVKE